ncbi:ERI1 exoribonuclease 3 [Caerostris darwini]|uniref:ERI1 exoribonuclease 3 n=1 Tax=Caerostris darwini TaxID=1538125 RepID=A0AAV4PXJ1_9ARAC|nr:ERI1 exoribonuclease 3 [Caerostris darwini]
MSSTSKRTFCNMMCKRNFSDTAESIQERQITVPSFVKLPPRTGKFQKQKFDYFLVLDFEATCDSPKTVIPQEVIEFPVLKVSGVTFETESVFQSYVKPEIHPELTKFCTQLTGITQETVDSYPKFEEVFEDFLEWMKLENLFNSKFTFVTVGDWDLKYLFPIQCKGSRISVPQYMKSWINLKWTFQEVTSVYPRSMITMMKYCELLHEGRLHSGLDDCKNIARVLKNLGERGVVFETNSGFNRS